jgi:hypothetical protein
MPQHGMPGMYGYGTASADGAPPQRYITEKEVEERVAKEVNERVANEIKEREKERRSEEDRTRAEENSRRLYEEIRDLKARVLHSPPPPNPGGNQDIVSLLDTVLKYAKPAGGEDGSSLQMQ